MNIIDGRDPDARLSKGKLGLASFPGKELGLADFPYRNEQLGIAKS